MNKIAILYFVAAACMAASPVRAQVSDNVVRFGVLTDMNGPSADGSGKGSAVAAQLAVDDFGGKVLGYPIEVITGDHQNKVDTGLGLCAPMVRH